MYKQIRATAISMRPRKWDKAYNADRLEALVRNASPEGPELVVATEGLLEGYVVMDVIRHPEKAAARLELNPSTCPT